MKNSNKRQPLTADKPQNFLLKDKKARPATSKPKKAEDLISTEAQDEGANLHKILAYYRARVEAHEKDRFMLLQKMD
jgi:hypothetical protein